VYTYIYIKKKNQLIHLFTSSIVNRCFIYNIVRIIPGHLYNKSYFIQELYIMLQSILSTSNILLIHLYYIISTCIINFQLPIFNIINSFILYNFSLLFFDMSTQKGKGRFKLVTFASWGMISNRLNYPWGLFYYITFHVHNKSHVNLTYIVKYKFFS